jgi:hypothetical protein
LAYGFRVRVYLAPCFWVYSDALDHDAREHVTEAVYLKKQDSAVYVLIDKNQGLGTRHNL